MDFRAVPLCFANDRCKSHWNSLQKWSKMWVPALLPWCFASWRMFWVDSGCVYVFPYKVCLRSSTGKVCGATVADHGRLMLGSWSDHARNRSCNGSAVSSVNSPCRLHVIGTLFSCSSIVFCKRPLQIAFANRIGIRCRSRPRCECLRYCHDVLHPAAAKPILMPARMCFQA